jgi:hypothetical protein
MIKKVSIPPGTRTVERLYFCQSELKRDNDGQALVTQSEATDWYESVLGAVLPRCP